ncbi:MAG: hypothetical protein H6751_14400 [Candidatus Omnitrophica bacterium]|nr:hypothetical protein [Candidatus Omnitrophota bacterium]
MKDPILEEIYEFRRQISEECGHDIERLIERLKTPKHEAIGQRVTPEDVRNCPIARSQFPQNLTRTFSTRPRHRLHRPLGQSAA